MSLTMKPTAEFQPFTLSQTSAHIHVTCIAENKADGRKHKILYIFMV